MILSAIVLLAQAYCWEGNSCRIHSTIMPCNGTVNSTPCPATPTPTPTPTPTQTPAPASPKESSLKWLPPLMNYVESPWAMRYRDAVYIGGHAGYCCGSRPDGQFPHDAAWVIRYTDSGAVMNYMVLPGATENDDHEVGGYSPLVIGNEWWLFGSRTEMSYWGSKGNRLRPFLVKTLDPLNNPWSVRRDPPLYYPVDPACKEMGSCEGIGNSQNGSALLKPDGKILVLSKDDVGTMRSGSLHAVYEIDKVTGNGTYLYTADFGRDDANQPYRPSFSDWAMRTDGSYVAYTGNQPVSNWYKSNEIVEWKSIDVGKTWFKTRRTWKPSASQCLWDVGVMKTSEGVVAEPLTLIAIASDKCEFATVQSAWYLWIWSEDRTKLPKTFGMIPEGPPVPTYSKTGLVDENYHVLVMKYKAQSDYCIYLHHESGPWMGRVGVFCGFGGQSGKEYTEKPLSLMGCGKSPCPVPPHKCSVSGWGIYDVEIYNENRPRPVIP